MPAPTMTDFEKSMLTKEELAGLANESDDAAVVDDETVDTKADPIKDAAGTDDEKDDEGEGEEEQEEAAAAAKPAPAKEAKPSEAKDEAAAQPELEASVPLLKEGPPKDWDALAAAIGKQFEEGEISQTEYEKQIRELSREETLAITRREFNEALQQQRWNDAQVAFLADNPRYKSEGLQAALNAHMTRIEHEQATAKKAPLSNLALLQEAHKALNLELGLVTPPAAEKDPGKPKQKTEAEVRQLAAKKAPTTLADVPNAEDPDDTKGDQFAVLDRLADTDGIEYEREIARLEKTDPAAHRRYMSQV